MKEKNIGRCWVSHDGVRGRIFNYRLAVSRRAAAPWEPRTGRAGKAGISVRRAPERALLTPKFHSASCRMRMGKRCSRPRTCRHVPRLHVRGYEVIRCSAEHPFLLILQPGFNTDSKKLEYGLCRELAVANVRRRAHGFSGWWRGGRGSGGQWRGRRSGWRCGCAGRRGRRDGRGRGRWNGLLTAGRRSRRRCRRRRRR